MVRGSAARKLVLYLDDVVWGELAPADGLAGELDLRGGAQLLLTHLQQFQELQEFLLAEVCAVFHAVELV